ncbi:hypothetical protein BD324DRAFT_651140 [Kockovaella imperatae]|uniref:Uncharacterized protein n=1 Tax=Kockovaella imperatae TaxID=4999 RepID=A0A1Y1UGM4_9TREE|nr:hypothetical protein BD324DRAFT_651140 [Kockovaella imperatae]ORX36654.1 hypothetical protein BD324DRAFT_651140 [Kockovaella imperatae]
MALACSSRMCFSPAMQPLVRRSIRRYASSSRSRSSLGSSATGHPRSSAKPPPPPPRRNPNARPSSPPISGRTGRHKASDHNPSATAVPPESAPLSSPAAPRSPEPAKKDDPTSRSLWQSYKGLRPDAKLIFAGTLVVGAGLIYWIDGIYPEDETAELSTILDRPPETSQTRPA